MPWHLVNSLLNSDLILLPQSKLAVPDQTYQIYLHYMQQRHAYILKVMYYLVDHITVAIPLLGNNLCGNRL